MIADYVATIGLEVHVQLATATKLFSACPYRPGAPANSLTDGYTLGLPGELPVVQRAAVEHGLRLALAVGAEPSRRSAWARKHYFYADLAKGYQITQADHPLARGGAVEIDTPAGPRAVGLAQIHLEEDAGKLIHADGRTLVDFNRAGVPLLEVVGRPELHTPAEAAAYLRELRAIVRALAISDAAMEAGSLRCDANVSLRRRGAAAPGTRCEIKNLNSFQFLEHALAAEIRRQADLLDAGAPVTSATLGYDPDRDRVYVQRAKEDAQGYRYLPEPDLPPLIVDPAWIAAVRAALPELPRARRARYRGLGLAAADAALLTAEPALARYFDAALALAGPAAARTLCSWLTVELLGRLHADGRDLADSPVPPAALAELALLALTGPQRKQVLARSYDERRSPRAIVADGGYDLADEPALLAAARAVLADHPQQRAQLLAGKPALRGFFVGQILRRLDGRADPARVHAVLDRLLADG